MLEKATSKGFFIANSRKLLERELETMGIRLNQTHPDVAFKLKSAGGLSFNATVKLTQMSEKLAYHVLHEYSLNVLNLAEIHHCEIVIRQDITVDEFIDVIVGNRKYIRCLYANYLLL
jgi:ribosome-interacting GTPase 1